MDGLGTAQTSHLADAKAAHVELGLGRLDPHLRRIHLPGGGWGVEIGGEEADERRGNFNLKTQTRI